VALVISHAVRQVGAVHYPRADDTVFLKVELMGKWVLRSIMSGIIFTRIMACFHLNDSIVEFIPKIQLLGSFPLQLSVIF
jgi:flagellar biosynthesis protein FliQ